MTDNIQITIRLPRDLWVAIKTLAVSRGPRKVGPVVIEALEQFLKNQEVTK